MAETLNSPAKPAAEALTPMQEETDVLLAQVGRQITDGTLDTSDQALFERLVKGFSDTRGMVRLRIAETLGTEIGKPSTKAVMQGLATHENPVVRRACGKTLTLIGNPDSIPTLLHALLNDEDTVVHGSCAGALARMGAPAVPALLELLDSQELAETTKGHVMWALAFNALEAKETFFKAYQSGSDAVRAAMVGAIAKVAQDEPQEERAFNLLVDALGDSVEDVRAEAAAVLGNLAYGPAVPPLLTMLRHEAAGSRKASSLALMKIGNRSAIDPLKAAVTQESAADVKAAMNLAISQLERKHADAEDDDWDI